jgi:hypothetical protein
MNVEARGSDSNFGKLLFPACQAETSVETVFWHSRIITKNLDSSWRTGISGLPENQQKAHQQHVQPHQNTSNSMTSQITTASSSRTKEALF